MTAKIIIARRSTTQVAPDGIFFEIDLTQAGFETKGPRSGEIYDPRFHNLYYFWDFGDSYQFKAPENLPKEHRDSGKSYGPMVSHTYRKPGRYAVSCLIVEPSTGLTELAEATIAVGDPEQMFTATNTIFVDPSGRGVGAPERSRVVTSVQAAIRMISGQESTPKRIMLRRGQTYAFGGTTLGNGAQFPSLHIVAGPGNDANPVLKCTGQWTWNDTRTVTNGRSKDWVFQNIDFYGPWDSTTERGGIVIGIGPQENSPNLTLIDGCHFDGFTGAYVPTSGNNVLHRMTVINDTTITNWQGFGVIDGDNSGIALTGSCIRQHANALAGKTDLTGNNNGPFRNGARLNRTIITNCDMFSRNGWSPFGGVFQASQACIRFNTDGMEGPKANIQANALEGGYWVLIFTPEAGLEGKAVNAVIEKNYILGSHLTSSTVVIAYGGTTIRNNILVQPNEASLKVSGELYTFIQLENVQGNARNARTPINIYNNTYIHLTPQSSYQFPDAPPASLIGKQFFSNVTEANNVQHMPNVKAAMTVDAPLEISKILWTPREAGYRSSVLGLQKHTATPRNVVASYAPMKGSAALGDALSGPVAYDDFYGNPRPHYPSRGAFEMP